MHLNAHWPRRGLYLLTPDDDDADRLCARVEAALVEPVALVQYRSKRVDPEAREAQARALLAICNGHGIPLLINDDASLAHRIGAHGAHLGADDGDLTAARALLGADAILGASCYDDLARAGRAAAAGASYLAFGAFFPSPTKPQARRASPALLAQATRLGLPTVAIGGVSADNARPLLDAGADLLAVISDVFDAPDIAAAVRRYAPLFQD